MQTRKWLITLIVVVVLTIFGWLIFNSRQLPASPPLPSPNGYDDFVKAGQLLADKTPDYRELSDENLRKLVTQNAQALNLVRTGLSRECRVPLVYSQSYMGDHLSELSSIKRLAQALNAEGRLAESEKRTNDAVVAYLEIIRLGQETMRGGVLIDSMVGVACEAIGLTGLQTLAANLNTGECRDVIKALETIEKKRESFEEVMQTEREWSRRAFPLYQRIVGSVMRLFSLASTKQAEQKAAIRFQTQERQRRELLTRVASRAYELEKGRPAGSMAELVPDYLKVIPKDPLTSTDMILKP